MKKPVLFFAVFLLFLTINALAQGNPIQPDANGIIYVNSAAAPGGDGSSWANAIPELADALKWARQQYDANSNFSISVYIAKGTYKPLYNAADRSYTTDGGRNNAFVMLKNLQLYGGFPNTGNPGFDDRDWNANPTILSGDIGTIGDNSDNTYHVVISSGPASSARLNGLTISGGNANNIQASIRVGGLDIVGSFGGGVFNQHSSPFIENTKILNNSAQLGGGGMFNNTSSPTIRNATISNNNSGIIGGGGMFNQGASPAIINTIFSNNHTNGAGGGMYNFTSSSPFILNTLISYNSAQQGGGGMYNNISSSPTIVNTTISNNSAGNLGGGMTNFNASPIVENSIIFGNRLTDGSVANISNGDPAFAPVFKYSLIGGATSWNPGWGTDGGNNIITTTNPFADAANGDFSLMPGTAAINGGSNTLYSDVGGGDKDLAGNNRVYDLAGGGIIDMGAYEYQGIPVHPDANGIIYVNSAAAPGGDGSSWANAIPELADALKWARQQHNADNNWLQNSSLRIYIAKGTYKPLYNAADGLYTTDGGRDNAFVMVENVQLYGGFPDTGNPNFEDRDWNANPTILSGNIGTANNNSDNTYHVVISAGYMGNASLDGLTISGGNTNGSGEIFINEFEFERESGGGMYNQASAPTILNTKISNNSAQMEGGGMYNYDSSPTILNTIISSNQAVSAGGGISNFDSSPTIVNTIISNNKAGIGGGMYNYDSSPPTIANTIISNNSADYGGGGMFNNFTSPIILNTTISNNSAGDLGGGMYNNVCFPTILNTTISNNSAQTVGGGMYNYDSSPVVNNSIVFGNRLANASVSNISNEDASTPVFKYSLLGGATSWNASWGTDGGNNIVTTSNPFADIVNGDFSLMPSAAAINGGSNALYVNAGGDLDDNDLAGNPRVYNQASGGMVDMGAYEYQGDPVRPDAGGILYVDITAAPGGDGSSWAEALPQLSDALHFARDNAAAWESGTLRIYVAKGTYFPEYRAHDNSKAINDRNNAFVMVKNVQLYGGFDPAAGAGTMDTRNPAANPTILSGDIGTANDASDNAHHVVIAAGDVGSTLLNGFTITKGYATGSSTITVNGQTAQTSAGGGIYNLASDPVLINLIISGNTAASGGGLYNLGASPHLINVAISGNSASSTGGGIRNFSGSDPVLTNVTIAGNNAGSGGGMANNASDPIFNNSILFGNTATTGNNIINADGSAIASRYSLMEGSSGWNSSWGTDGGNNVITTRSPFVDIAAGNYQMTVMSPAVNAGSNALYTNAGGDLANDTDLAGNARVFDLASDGIIDLGAYEFQGNPVRPDAGGILYVDIAAAPGGDGSSWAEALPQLSEALHFARDNAAAWESGSLRIYVAKGTYFPEYRAHDNSKAINDRNNAFVMVKNVQLYGGFDPAAGAGTMDTRNWAANPTILSGDIGTTNDASDNAHHVVIAAGDVGNALLDGFTITKGNATGNATLTINGQTAQTSAGGGIYNLASDPVLTNLIISGNAAASGGGMYNIGASPHLTNVAISGNSAGSSGGGIRNFSGSDPVLTNVTIAGNTTAGSGGGMANNASDPIFNNSILFGNTATTGNNIINADGSAIASRYSLMEGSSGWNSSWGTDGGGNIITAMSPFVDIAAGNYRMTVMSPAVNAGSNALYTNADGDLANDTDLAGNARVFDLASDGIIDMGAYEFQGNPVRPDAGGILYVDITAAPGGDGSSWAEALPQLSDALHFARDNAAAWESGSLSIYVAKGTYLPEYRAHDNSKAINDRNDAFVMVKNVQLFGGFDPAAGAGTMDTRNPAANPTILSGDIGTANDASDNAHHVVIAAGDAGSALLDGFTITNGNANGSAALTINGQTAQTSAGGGIYNLASDPVLINLIISGNTAASGGGLYNLGASPHLMNVAISGNTAGSSGGGIRNFSGSDPVLTNVTIAGNTAGSSGGGMANNASSPSVNNSILFGNTAATENNIANTAGSAIASRYSLMEGSSGWNSNWGTDGGNNIITTTSPFVDIAAGNYRMTVMSPAVNAGSNTLYTNAGGNLAGDDLAGNPRVYNQASGGIVDMGAYEFQGNPVRPDAGGILYVDIAAAPGGDGSSWAKALSQLSDALHFARDNAAAWESGSLRVYVAKGTYFPEYRAHDNSKAINDRNNAFVMVKNVQLFGGFDPAAGAGTMDTRNPAANPTILSGDIGTANDASDNAHHVVISAGDVGNALLNGFTITRGNATGNGTITVNGQTVEIIAGGGIYNLASAPALMNLTISENMAESGGGMYNINASPRLTNVLISGNSAGTNGGGIRNFNSSDPALTNVTIAGNTAGSGGGMANNASSPIFNNSILFGNTAITENNIANTAGSATASRYSLLEGSIGWNSSWGTDGGGNIITTASPFVDIAAGNYRMTVMSPAVNAGSSTLYTNAGGDLADDNDLAGQHRVYNQTSGGIIDMGAYEFQGDPVRPDADGILYVDITAAPGGDGSSWAEALPQLSDALHFARDNAAAWESGSLRIYVAKGTYLPEYRAHDNSKAINDRNDAFVMVKNVQLFGGFDPAAGAGTMDTRNPAANPTILSGDIGTANDASDNAHHVVIAAGDAGSALLDGFTITNGNANGSAALTINGQTAQTSAGGGIYNLASDPALTNLIISGNTAASGGGMYNLGASPNLINVAISGNTAGSSGGGVRNFSGSDPILTNVTIAGNTAGSGGGMANNASSPIFNNSILFGNTAATESNIINAAGSAIVFRYSLMEGSSGWNSSWGTDGGGNIITTTNPFADAANGDFSLASNSPAINTGNNSFNTATTDLMNNPRIFGAVIDMGAYEDQRPVVIHPDANGIMYVDSAAAPNGDGSSWATALTSFELALSAANTINTGANSPADSVRQVWVAKGTYQPATAGLPFLNFTPLKIYGGFSGTEQSLTQRDLSAGNKSILKGNEGTVFGNANNTGLVIVDGFEITGGNVSAGSTAGIGNSDGKMIISNCIVSNNIAGLLGGGIGNDYGGDLTVVNSIVVNNVAETGGGILNLGKLTVINCVVANNTAQDAGAIYSGGSSLAASSISNSIVWGNTTTASNNDVVDNTGIPLIISYSIVEGGYAGTGNLDADPQFADPAARNYRLRITSPGINTGINDSIPDWVATDLAENPRIYDLSNSGIIDMGAYEYQENVNTTKIIIQPEDSTVCEGAAASFNISATGSNLQYQWQSAIDGGDIWNNVDNATTTTLTISNTTSADSGSQYRAIVAGDRGTDTSASATLHVNTPVLISLQPHDTTVNMGEDAAFSVLATGSITGYHWQSSSDGNSWNNVASGTTETLNLSSLTPADSGMFYRVVVSGSCGDVTSSSATLHINHPVLTLTPSALNNAFAGSPYSVTFEAHGGNPPYTYTLSNSNLPATLTLSNGTLSGIPTVPGNYTFDVTATDASTGTGAPFSVTRHYSLEVSSAGSCIAVSSWPSSKTVCAGSNVNFTVTGTGIDTYQWQSKAVKAATWQDIKKETNATLSFNNVTVDQSGMQYRVILSSQGCGSLTSQPVTLIVNAIKHTMLNETICFGSVYNFNGTNISQSGIYSDTLTSYTGCDSIVVLNLTVRPEIKTTLNKTICFGGIYNFNGTTISHSGTYKDTLNSYTGCDSIVVLNLTVRPEIKTTLDKTICFGGIYNFNGTDINQSGMYTDTLTSYTGCDSIVVLKLTVRPEIKTTLDKTICFGGVYNFNGTTISQSGTYKDTLTSYTSCDSVVVLKLTVRKEIKTMLDETICFGSVYNFGGKNISQSGMYSDTLTSYTGCDSVVVLNLTVRPENKTTLDEIICFGGVYNFNGTDINQSGMYSDTLSSYTGCDSVVVLNLTVRPEIKTTLNKTICFGGVYNFNGTDINQSGIYSDTLTSYTGCDSIVVLNLTVRPEIKTTLDKTICFGSKYNFGGEELSQSGTYSDTLTSYTGCDSVVVLNLTVRPEIKTTLDKTICFGGVYNFNGTTISQSGTYSDTLTSYTGCDSMVVLNLTVRPEIKTTLDETICFGGIYNFNGTTISQSGTYKDTLTSYTGCDSIVVLNLTVRPENKTTINQTICEGDSYAVGNNKYTETGTYQDTLLSNTGCDSIVVLNLTVNPKTRITTRPENQTVCDGSDAAFEVAATGTNLKYQWQSSADGTSWNNVRDGSAATLKLSNVGTTLSGTKYHVVVTGICDVVTSEAVTLTVNKNTAITTQPTSTVVCEGSNATFKVKATGTKITYQWQSSKTGSDWKNLSGATKETLNLSNLTATDNGRQFRVVVTGTCETVTSDAVTLTVNPLPTINIVSDKANPVSKGLPIQLTATGQAGNYRWASGPGIQSGWNEATVTIRPMQDATYTVTGTTAAGCKATQSYDVKVIVDYKLICNNIVSPNGDGKNDRWIIQNIDAYPVNEVMIFDRAGRMIYQKKTYNNQWDGTVIGRPLQEGTYYYVFKVDGGKKIFKGFIEVLR